MKKENLENVSSARVPKIVDGWVKDGAIDIVCDRTGSDSWTLIAIVPDR